MTWVIANFGQIWQLTLDHIALSVPPIVVGFLLAVPLGWIAHRYRLSRGVILTVCGLLYALPSLPLFFLMPVIIGTQILDPANVVIALSAYAVALLARTAADAFDSVEPGVRRSATAVGYSGWGRFWKVDLPLAGPVLLAGLRVVSASTISLVSVGALLGVPSLGYLFTDGYNRSFPTEALTGVVGTVVIAVVFDLILVGGGRLLMPWVRVTDARGRASGAVRRAATA
ncbi:ABC transporter permease subunit [Okibacterium endophyticum]